MGIWRELGDGVGWGGVKLTSLGSILWLADWRWVGIWRELDDGVGWGSGVKLTSFGSTLWLTDWVGI